VNGRGIGTTSVIVWSQTGEVTLYTVEVTADAETIERQIKQLYPDVAIAVAASGNHVILSGQLRDPAVARRALELASASGASVINNLEAPTAELVLLRVRFAEVSRSAVERFSTAIGALNPHRLSSPNEDDADSRIETLSDGIVRLFLLGAADSLDVLLTALKGRGEFRSLAEPNLLALAGEQASFLAGGEFPFPVVQGVTGAVTIVWKEFGVRLIFTPEVTNTGGIRLTIEPEVSSLDFANALSFEGFRIPSVLTRRARTEVELREGEHLAIAGLLDNTRTENITKIPLLGDIPILGTFFRSKDAQQNRSELLVLVTPHIIEPSATAPAVPTGEPDTWKWMRGVRPQDMRRPSESGSEGPHP
jgi:pilus assembly protein CpaC